LHKGGRNTILEHCGKERTTQFHADTHHVAVKLPIDLQTYVVGVMIETNPPSSTGSSDTPINSGPFASSSGSSDSATASSSPTSVSSSSSDSPSLPYHGPTPAWWMWMGIVVGCTVIVAVIIGLVTFYVTEARRKEQERKWLGWLQEKAIGIQVEGNPIHRQMYSRFSTDDNV